VPFDADLQLLARQAWHVDLQGGGLVILADLNARCGGGGGLQAGAHQVLPGGVGA
jgi:hypothetical protein